MMKRLTAIMVAAIVLLASSLSAFADYSRYEVKDYSWYGKYTSSTQGNKVNVGSERQYSEMKMIYDQWKSVKALHKELENKVLGKYSDPKLQRAGLISVLDRLSDKVNSYYGVTNNNWDTKANIQVTVDGLTPYRMNEENSFIRSVYAEYALTLNMMYMGAVMSDNAADYVKSAKNNWKSANYYYLIMDTLVKNMKFTSKGFSYNGTVSADVKTLISQKIGQVAETTEQAIKTTQPATATHPDFDISTLSEEKRIHYDGLDPKPDYVNDEGYGYTGSWFFGDVKNGMTMDQVVTLMGYAKYQYANKLVYVIELSPGVKQYVYFYFNENEKTSTMELSFPIYENY